MKRKWLFMFVCSVLLSMMIACASFANEYDDELIEANVVTVYEVNPIGESMAGASYINVYENGPAYLAMPVFETDNNKVSALIREGMVNRESTITVYYQSSQLFSEEEATQWIEDRFYGAFVETSNSREGDYLRYSYKNYGALMTIYAGENVYIYETTYAIQYYTTYAEEYSLDLVLEHVLNNLGVTSSAKTNYEKVRLIYDYVTSHVKYDYENLYNDAYLLKYSAYAALVNESAVCQGYATLMYRMLEMCGIDCRVITGESFGDGHAWNIVKLNGQYYLLDATWDAGATEYTYFLKGLSNFPNHAFAEEFTQGSFTSAYPISATDYSDVQNEEVTYTVLYIANGGNEKPDAQTKVSGQALTIASTNATQIYTVTYEDMHGFSSAEKEFKATCVGWNTKADGTGVYYKPGDVYSLDADLILYAQYEATIGELPTPECDGMFFLGWYSEDKGGAQISAATKITSDMTIYAHWQRDLIHSFVCRLYNECLYRAAEPEGLEDWKSQLKSGTLTGAGAAYGIVFSQEYKNRCLCNEDFVENMYRAFMGRVSDAGGKADWVGKLESGVSREAVFNGFAMSREFSNLCAEYGILVGSAIEEPQKGTGATGVCSVCGKNNSSANAGVAAFVTRLYTICLGRTPDAHGLNDWSTQLSNHTNTGRGVAYGFIFSPEFTNKKLSNDEYVECLYNAFFDRPADAGGKADWMNRLKMGWSREQVFDGFVGSQEFTNLCNKYGITRD